MMLTKWLNRMVKIILLIFFITQGKAQQRTLQEPHRLIDTITTLTLPAAEALARANYPLLKQQSLIRTAGDLQQQNINSGWLPQFTLGAQATMQSDVTRVNISVPGIKIEAPERDQYKIFTELNQLLYDGGVSAIQRNMSRLESDAKSQQLEVEMYQLKQKVRSLYIGVIYFDQLMQQQLLAMKDIQTGIATTTALVNNGVAFRSNVQVLQAELLRAKQRQLELEGSRAALVNTLSVLINRQLDSNTTLVAPTLSADNIASASGPVLHRAELLAIEKNDALLRAKRSLVAAGNKPRVGLFVQGGYGRPALNMLQNQFDWYYIGGIRFTWNLAGLYTAKKDKELIELQQRTLDTEKETFIVNTNAALAGAKAEVERIRKVIETDDEIITLRVRVANAARAQLENGVITANDYLREINAADQAHQARITHQVQLLKALIDYNNLQGEPNSIKHNQ